jgi:hypothetical protein
MLDALVLTTVAVAGYLDAPGWTALAGAAALTVAGWWRKVALLRQHPKVPFSSKMTTYLVVSVAINLGFAAASLVIGRAARLFLQG